MAVDFSQLLRQQAGKAERPKALPIGEYPGMVRGWEPGNANRNQTPYVRFSIVLTGWPDSVNFEDRGEVDVTKRTLRRDFFLTPESFYRLDLFIKSCGVEPRERSYEEVLPELVGQPVVVSVGHYINNSTGEIGNNVGDVVGINGK
jgi:hypothetical protein